jgi:hypothetical protein
VQVVVIVGFEIYQKSVYILRSANIVGESALDKALYSVADITRILFDGMGGESPFFEGVVSGVAEVGDGVEESSVEVKNYELFQNISD